MRWIVVADSGCDLRSVEGLAEGVAYDYVPMKLIIGDQEFVDDTSCDVAEMMRVMAAYGGKTSSACPNAEEWAEQFRRADKAIAVTISSNLSGSYNAAMAGRAMVLEECPDKQIYVLDSLSAGAGMSMLVEEALALAEADTPFEDVIKHLESRRKKTKLVFMLKSLDNLVKNGRVSKLLGTAVGMLGIRVVAQASDVGTVEMIGKGRGFKRGLNEMLSHMRATGCKAHKIIVCHAFAGEELERLVAKLEEHFPGAKIKTMACSALCSYYAEQGGMLVAYEI